MARAISKILFILGSYNFLAYLECVRSYAWSKGHSEPDLSSVTRIDTCETTRYTALHKVKKSWLENKSVVWVVFESPEVVHYNTYINYDILSLIGDLGGKLGLTLGASATSLLDSLLQNIPYY